MVKTAKEIADYFSSKDPNKPVHIEWFEKEEAEFHIGEELTNEQFVDIFEFVDDTGFVDSLSDAMTDYQRRK
jgi:hypothetical protein